MARLKQAIVGVNKSSIDDDNFPKKSLRYAFGMISEWHRNLRLTKKGKLTEKSVTPSV